MQSIPLALIDANPNQPRKTFEAGALNELANSILSEGLLQPPTVRPMLGGRYELVAGERRWRACKLLAEDRGLSEFVEMPCLVVEMTDLQRDIAALIENLQRKDVPPLEESDGIFRLLINGMAPYTISERLGIPLLRVKWRLSLQKLAPDIRKLLSTGNIDQQAANEIARLDRHADQFRMLRLIQSGKLVGWKAVRSAVDAILQVKDEADIFGEAAPRVSEEDVGTLNEMERKIERMAAMAAAGWKDGECQVAIKVSRDRTRLMADKLAAMRTSLGTMERALRNAAAEADAVLAI